MKWLHYLRLFYFISSNWNARLAFFTVYHEIRGERKYDIDTSEIDDLHAQQINSANIRHAAIYQPTNYFLLEKAFAFLQAENISGHFVDYGCGKGRVLTVAAFFGFQKITGVDFSEAFCREATWNTDKIKSIFPATEFRIVCADVVSYNPLTDEVFFFFNPFDEVIMLAVVKKILASLRTNPRKIFAVYINPLHKEIFLSAGFVEEYYFRKMKYLEFVVMSKDRDDF